MVNCDYENYGCHGGYLVTSAEFLMTEGTTTLDCKSYKNSVQKCTFECDDQ